MLSADSEIYEDDEGTRLTLIQYDGVRITDPDDYYLYEDGVITMDEDGNTQIIPKEYFNKYFRLMTLEEAI